MNQQQEVPDWQTLLALAQSESESDRMVSLLDTFILFEKTLEALEYYQRTAEHLKKSDPTMGEVLRTSFDCGWFAWTSPPLDRDRITSALRFRNGVLHEHKNLDVQGTAIAVHALCCAIASLKRVSTPLDLVLEDDGGTDSDDSFVIPWPRLFEKAKSNARGDRLLAIFRGSARLERVLKEFNYYGRVATALGKDDPSVSEVLQVAFDNGWFSALARPLPREQMFSAIRLRNDCAHGHANPSQDVALLAVYSFSQADAILRGLEAPVSPFQAEKQATAPPVASSTSAAPAPPSTSDQASAEGESPPAKAGGSTGCFILVILMSLGCVCFLCTKRDRSTNRSSTNPTPISQVAERPVPRIPPAPPPFQRPDPPPPPRPPAADRADPQPTEPSPLEMIAAYNAAYDLRYVPLGDVWQANAVDLGSSDEDVGWRREFNCVPGGLEEVVYGHDYYGLFSSVCTAAVHAGRIDIAGGRVVIEIVHSDECGGQHAHGNRQHGIRSRSYRTTGRCFVFRDGLRLPGG